MPDTMSWYFTATGVTMMMLAGLLVIVDTLGHRRAMRPFIEVGQNSMFCYVVYSIFLNSIFEMIPALRPVLRSTAGGNMLRAVLSLTLVMLIVQLLTRKRIFWRT